MNGCPPRVGRAATRVAAAFLVGAVVASSLATAAPAAFGATAAGGQKRVAPVEPPPLHFPGLQWNSTRADVARVLARRGFRRSPDHGPHSRDESWRGRWLDEPATCIAEWREGGRLVSVTLRFEPRTSGDALQLYGALSTDFRRRYGEPLVEVAPTRPEVLVEHRDLRRRLARRTTGEGPSAARFWGATESGGAMVQLDGAHVVWLRWEAPGWEPEFAPDYPSPRR